MAQMIEVPGMGMVEFPDGMSDEQIVAAIKSNTGAQQPAQPAQPSAQEEVPGVAQTLLIGAGRGVDQLAKGVQQLYYKATDDQGALKKLAAQVEADDAVYSKLQKQRPVATSLGEMAPAVVLGLGSGGASLPAAMARSALMTGAPEALRYGTTEERVSRGLIGGAGGAIGAGAGWGIGRLLQPAGKAIPKGVSNEAMEAASRLGYKPTPGQATNSPSLLALENNWLRKSGSGAVMEKAYNAQQQALNKAAARAMGESADNLGPQVMARAESRIGQEFKRLQDITRPDLDAGFLDSLIKIDSANAAKGAFASKKVDNLVTKGLSLAEQGKLTGKAYKEIHTELSNQASRAYKAGDATTGQAFKALRDALDDAAGQSLSGADAAAWRQARQQWGAFKTLAKSNVAEGGDVSAARVAASLRRNGTGFRTGKVTGDLADIGRIGEGFKPLPNPTSGQLAAGGPLDFLFSAGRGAAASAYMSPLGQRYVTRGLLDIGPTGHLALSRGGGLLGAPYAQGLLGVK